MKQLNNYARVQIGRENLNVSNEDLIVFSKLKLVS